MGRHPDPERRTELLDEVVGYLGRNGVAGVSLRPVARDLGVSVNALVHHFGSKDELVVAALRRAAEIQRGVEGRWRRQVPHLSTVELQRRWWRWINRSPEHLALVRLGLEAATLDATVSGLPGDVRAEQISFWREDIADGLIADGIKPEDAEREASLVKATFTGLVLDLLATGHRKRLTDALECALGRLDALRQTAPGRLCRVTEYLQIRHPPAFVSHISSAVCPQASRTQNPASRCLPSYSARTAWRGPTLGA
jgi:AcrR family transcriptional regulator